MVFDLTLRGDSYCLQIHKKFFCNQSFPLSLFQIHSPLMDQLGYLGKFEIEGPGFGFAGCFHWQSEDDNYIYYVFNFPSGSEKNIRDMMMTVHLATYYVLDQMYHAKEFIDDLIYADQSLGFQMVDGGFERGGYSISGQIYPWFRRQLHELSPESLKQLNDYVSIEINRVSNYFTGKDLYYSQVTIGKSGFFIQVNMNGRWVDYHDESDLSRNKPVSFSSHNIDFRSDQEACFSGIIALNTYLRDHSV